VKNPPAPTGDKAMKTYYVAKYIEFLKPQFMLAADVGCVGWGTGCGARI